MAQKQLLHELLEQDQEPFLLNTYIADKIRKAQPRTQIQLRRPKPIAKNSSFGSNIYKNACFLSFHESPEPRRSPILPSPPKSPCKNPNAVFLHIPAALIEAALRIQKQSSKTKPQNRNSAFGLLGSFLKRLTSRSQNQKREIAAAAAAAGVSVKDILRWGNSSLGRRKSGERQGHKKTKSFSGEVDACSEINDQRSSTIWSETNEEKSLDLSTSGRSQSADFESIEHFVSMAFGSCENSPFHFVLQKSPSHSGYRTPFFPSPAASPIRRNKQDKRNNYEVDGLKKLQQQEGEEDEEEEEEEKEQNSPVSVFDPPFEDEDDGHVDADVDNEFDLECSYAIVQRTKQQLLQKLRRFEKLAELDPVELEKRMLEQEEEEEYDGDNDDDDEYGYEEATEPISSDKEMNFNGLVKQTPQGIKKLVLDLIAEENTEHKCCSAGESTIKTVLTRLDSWKFVESNTIDMMVEGDLRREVELWKKSHQQVEDMTVEVEFAILGLLIEELSQEMSYSIAKF